MRLYLTDKIDVDQAILDRLIKSMLYSRNTFFPYGAAYQVAQNSGRINAIIDQDLMKLLSEYYQNNYERVRINNVLHDDAITKPLAIFYPKLMVRKEFSNDRELNEKVLKKRILRSTYYHPIQRRDLYKLYYKEYIDDSTESKNKS